MALPVHELWRQVPGWEGKYFVSDFGRAKSKYGILTQRKNSRGYKTVSLERREKGKRISTTCFVHRLVAQAFLPNPGNLPQVNHKDENPSNNTVDNLEWCTAKYNMNYGNGAKTRHLKIDYNTAKRKEIARINGAKTTSKGVLQINKKGEIVARYKSVHEAYRATKIYHISDVANGSKTRSTAGGFYWSFSKGGVL